MLTTRLSRVLSLAVLWACAVCWAVSATVWQPVAEQAHGPGPLEIGTYWMRDLRIAVMVLAASAIVWRGSGRRGVGWCALAVGAAWLVLDVVVDRADPAGAGACVGLATTAGLLLTGLWWWAGRGGPGDLTEGLSVAAVLAVTVANSQMWVPTAPESVSMLWTPLRLALLAVGCVVVLGCVAAAGRGSVVMLRTVLGALVVVSLALSFGPVPWLWTILLFALYVWALTATTGALWAARTPAVWLGACAAVVLGWVLPLSLVMMTWAQWWHFLSRYNEWVIGDYLTALAGNPPVYDPQAYTPSLYLAGVVGLFFGAVVIAGGAVARRTPASPSAPVPSDAAGPR
ncbi:hypothetical protein [Pseudonocardia spinosispora]|uniref:hypothetical protein n=1 Tax=Pseudonocardia spinosispora TaxID=103441 RepID=UPI00048FE398|nr:hypothetical protein [Pseudonocardia spinosispora]